MDTPAETMYNIGPPLASAVYQIKSVFSARAEYVHLSSNDVQTVHIMVNFVIHLHAEDDVHYSILDEHKLSIHKTKAKIFEQM